MLDTVTVGEVMRSPVVTAAPDDAIGTVADRLADADVGSVVIADDERPVGIVTVSDVVDWYREGTDRAAAVETVMAAPPVTIERSVPLRAAAARMREADVSTLPVVGEGRLVGVVSTTDLSNYLPEITLAGAPAHERSERRRNRRPDTAYEHDDWTFESYGANDDRIEVGDVVAFEKTLSTDDVAAFAEASGDTNRVHLDDDYAAESRFGRRIVHGTLVAGLISAALARLPGLIVYLSQSLSYSGPVDVDGRARAECEVLEALGNERYRLSTTVRTDGETVVDGEATVLADPLPDTA